jgi:hypothetical protein
MRTKVIKPLVKWVRAWDEKPNLTFLDCLVAVAMRSSANTLEEVFRNRSPTFFSDRYYGHLRVFRLSIDRGDSQHND